MKKILYIAALTLICGFTSCNKDFLIEKPADDIYADNLLVNYAGFVNMQNALFSMVRDEYDRTDRYMGGTNFPSLPFAKSTLFSVGADNAWGNNRHSEFRHFSFPKNITSMTDSEAFLAIFEWLYKTINTANMIITRSENPDVDWGGASVAEANKINIVANARLIRAWAYRHLTYTFGAVPLSVEEITGSNYRTDWERNSVEEIRAEMEKDFKYAIDHLPLRTPNNTTPSGAIARHYLGELYLAMGKPAEAKAVLEPLVTGGEYSLMNARFGKNAANPGNCFIDIFRTPYFTDGNREVLWAFPNTEPENASYGISPNVFMRNMWTNYYSNLSNISSLSHSAYPGKQIKLFWSINGGKGAGRVTIALGAYKLYEYDDQQNNDIRYDDYSMIWHLYFLNEQNETYEVLTPAGASLINMDTKAQMTNDSDPTIQQYNLPSTRKWSYVHPNFEQSDIDMQYNDMVYMRLAETYLLYAEVLYKLGDASCVDWINKIRTRAGVSSITMSEMSIDFILDERSRELITEEQRRHTLIRLSQENGGNERLSGNIFKTRVRTHNEVSGRPVRGMHDDDTPVLYPIPKTFIDSNSGRTMQQNPGY